MTRKPMYHADDADETFAAGDELYEECEICHQEFRGVCPINSADCPYADDDEEEDEVPDFEDVEDLDVLIGDDEEIEKIIEEDVKIPLDDLVDEEEKDVAGDEEEGPSKTIEELEAEREGAEQAGKRGKKKAPSKKAAAKKVPPPKKKK